VQTREELDNFRQGSAAQEGLLRRNAAEELSVLEAKVAEVTPPPPPDWKSSATNFI